MDLTVPKEVGIHVKTRIYVHKRVKDAAWQESPVNGALPKMPAD